MSLKNQNRKKIKEKDYCRNHCTCILSSFIAHSCSAYYRRPQHPPCTHLTWWWRSRHNQRQRTGDQSGEPVSQPERNLNTVRIRHLHQPPPETTVRNRKPEEAPLVFHSSFHVFCRSWGLLVSPRNQGLIVMKTRRYGTVLVPA